MPLVDTVNCAPPVSEFVVTRLTAGAGVPVTSPRDGRGSGILCVAPDRVAEAHRRLKAERIICSLREGSIRLSPHCYTTVAEMERVAEVLGAG